jgi:transmembrane sensor
MTKPEDTSGANANRIAHQAAYWFARLLETDTRDNDYPSFREWLQADPMHAEAYARLERLWSAAGSQPPQSNPSLSRRGVLKAGGGLLAILGIAGSIELYRQGKPDFKTDVGQRQVIALEDGSEIELSAATSFSVAFTRSERRLLLHQGEIYCRVAASPGRPFIVEAGNLTATALGTAYSVAIQPDGGAGVTVTEHDVLVELGGSSRTVSAGESVDARDGRLSYTVQGENENRLAWTRGSLVFLSTPLGDVIASLNRWRKGRLVVLDEVLAARPITAIIDVSRIETIDQTLGDGLGLHITSYTPWLTLVSAK